MGPDDISLCSVNWEHGMLLTPEHFIRQERYFDSALAWILRYTTGAHGLVGGGPRLPDNERGAVRNDPVVTVDQDDESLGIAVTQCRGLTPAGWIVDIDPVHPVHRRFPKASIEGAAQAQIHIVCVPHQKDPTDGSADTCNPQMKTERHPTYDLSLGVDAVRAPYSLAVARLSRLKYGPGYEKDPEFIPPCTSMVSHSELAAAWRKTVDMVTRLAERYTGLYRNMQEFLSIFRERGIESELDLETVAFVGRMVIALQTCIDEILDPVQSPETFFRKLQRFYHSAAVYLDISPPAWEYFNTLKNAGITEFISPVEQQKEPLRTMRDWRVRDDLRIEVRAASQSLSALEQMERALEGKYVDFRISPSLEAMNFIFDRGGQVLYKLVAKPSRVQGFADELTFVFDQLRLEGREKYRLILAGEEGATCEKGIKITAEIRLNELAGFRRQPIILSSDSKSSDQRNFEFDFEAPDVATINDLRVILQAHHPIRTALLFVRYRFFAPNSREVEAKRVIKEEKQRDGDPGKSRERLGDRLRIPAEPPGWERSRSREGTSPSRERPAEPPRQEEPPAVPPIRRKRLD